MKSYINASQIRAARAILEWSQEDLAERTALSITTIRKIESGGISPRDTTNDSILAVLEDNGIEFTPPEGVNRRKNKITVLDGADSYLHLLNIIYEDMNGTEDTVLVWNADNRVSPPEVIEQEKKMRDAGIRFRFLIEEHDTYLYFPLNEYRWIPKQYYRNNVQTVFGNKVALSIHTSMAVKQLSATLIIESQPLAESMRNTFNFIWDSCRQPTHSTSKLRIH
ncbi:MAG: helix-turn-helix domain-containing protein [Alphaproteobacteria bacterium]|nr:helix-turn-helix domain-containing protein [Alphaproteobacteria bacterium]MBV8548778.1 helix-turn-helix domain-containing protein [Alphaproteobacteria bacterium]